MEGGELRIFSDLNALSEIPNPVVTIGTFDGVHLGHQKILRTLFDEAERVSGESVLFTFYPHPRMILFPESHGMKLLQTQEEKIEKLAEFGLQNLIIYPFSFDFSRLTALEFVRDILIDKLHARKIVIGYDHQFGKNREGNIQYLKDIAETYDFEVIEIPAQDIDEVNVSSTKIREALLQGDVKRAADFLGQPYMLSGKVVRGKSLGRTIGYPTANIEIKSDFKLVPAIGVYAVEVFIDGIKHRGMLNIGIRPTISFTEDVNLEVHIFDFQEDIYDQTISIKFIARVRDEQKFESLEALKEQLKNDEKFVRTSVVFGT
jgi:riboflavin kinase/FMN adenylyltransferase